VTLTQSTHDPFVTCERCHSKTSYAAARLLGWSKGSEPFTYRCNRCQEPVKQERPRHPFDTAPELERMLEREVKENVADFKDRWDDYALDMEQNDRWLTLIKRCGLKNHLMRYWHALALVDGKTPLPDDRTVEVFKRVEKEAFGKCVEDNA
jgi:hypothetical protein